MRQATQRSACGDLVHERSLLDAPASARWQGLPIGWIEISPHVVSANLTTPRDVLVMIDSGVVQADFRFGRRATSWEFAPDSIGCFVAGTQLDASRWRWTPTRRIYVDLEAPFPAGADLLDDGSRGRALATEIEFRDAEVAAVLRSMAREVAEGCPNGRLYAESLSLGVLSRLRQRAQAGRSVERERGRLTARQLRVIEETVRGQLGRDLGIAGLASAIGFSAPQFARLFKRTLGCTPHRYVLQARLDRAMVLAIGSDRPLADIAFETGFASQSHMTAAFARRFGTTPGAARRHARSTGASSR
jgi:AraC family transcriptional regulator